MYFSQIKANMNMSETKYETNDFVNANIVWVGDMKYFQEAEMPCSVTWHTPSKTIFTSKLKLF